ncbi:MAG: DUF2231 domain-containing protein [Ignavibacteriaceae bacterium]
MKTRASFKGHPIHQMLIPFPIAFLAGALIFDLLGITMRNSTFWVTGAYLAIAGILMAVVAATPGFIDYLFSVPPKSSAKTRATRHMVVNLIAVFIFLVAVIMRIPIIDQPDNAVIILEIIGAGFLGAGGWLGGTLVNRNFIGPDHRYPYSGKWKEMTVFPEAGQSVKIALVDELKVNQMKLIHANDKRIVLAKTEEGYVAFDDFCTHRGGSLAGGVMICGTVQCLWHGSQFDVKTGMVKSGPAEKDIPTYKIEVKNDGVFLLPF